MYKKNAQDISEQDFQRHNKLACKSYQQPSPKHPTKPNEFDKLVYVAAVFSKLPKGTFNHGDASPFESITPRKK
jgi:hypothetical protein